MHYQWVKRYMWKAVVWPLPKKNKIKTQFHVFHKAKSHNNQSKCTLTFWTTSSLRHTISLQFFLKVVFHKFYLVHSWIPSPIWKNAFNHVVNSIVVSVVQYSRSLLYLIKQTMSYKTILENSFPRFFFA